MIARIDCRDNEMGLKKDPAKAAGSFNIVSYGLARLNGIAGGATVC